MKKIIKSIFKWTLRIVGGLAAALAVWAFVIWLQIPPTEVTPGKDSLASGAPALPFPKGDIESYEPHIAVDPNDPNHIVVGAMTGIRFGRGGTDIYRWFTRDGGKTWSGDFLTPYTGKGVFAADVVMAFDEKGRDHIVTMYGSTPLPQSPVLIEMVSRLSNLLTFGQNIFHGYPTVREAEEEASNNGQSLAVGDPATGKVSFPIPLAPKGTIGDKPWIAVDNASDSPFRGSVYAAWTDIGLWDNSNSIHLASSRDGGKTVSKSKMVAPLPKSSLVALTTGPAGRVDVAYVHGPDLSIAHVSSSDGGATFSKPVFITPPYKDRRVIIPVLTTAKDGTVMACWSEVSDTVRLRINCATKRDNATPWSRPVGVDQNIAARGIVGLPAVAANDQGLWVAGFRSDKKTEVVLYRSIDRGATFQEYSILASRNFGADSICIDLAGKAQCRVNMLAHNFNPGDYMGLSATGNRVAAAFTFPLGNDPVQFATTYVKIFDVAATTK